MKHFCSIFFTFVCCFLMGLRPEAQVVSVTNPGFTTPALAASYASLASAITALNNITIISGGTVTITLNAPNNQTAPVGGYAIQFLAVTTAANNIVIEGSGNTITAFSPQVSGQAYDAIFKIIGSDYVTIQNFVMRENPLNSTTTAPSNNMTEWGVALLYASATNGAQNNTIQNNTISLNKTYSNTFGIYSNTNHTPTVVGMPALPTSINGANSGNKVYGNAISNVNMGICFVGAQNVNYMDIGNDIGGSSLSTGNTITNWGGIPASSSYYSSSGSCYGITLDNQKGDNASYNTITSATLTGTPVSVRGIFKDYNNSPTGTFTTNILNNTISINYGFTSTSTFEGITTRNITTLATNFTININSNLLTNNNISAVSTPNFIGIYNNCLVGVMNINSNTISGTTFSSSPSTFTGISNAGAAASMNINSNIIRGTTSASASSTFTGISNIAAVTTTLNINSNNIGDASGNAITYSVANSGSLTGITVPTVGSAASVSISNNNFQGFVQTVAGSGPHTYINLYHTAGSATIDNINGNTFTNLTANTSGSVTFITRDGTAAIPAGSVENCNNNSIVTAFSKPRAGGTVTLYGAFGGTLSGNSMVQTGNDFSNITLTGATTMAGWVNYEGGASGPVKTITNNIFTNWICGSIAAYAIQSGAGDNGTTVSTNTITNISDANGITAISIAANNKGALQSCSNNIISGLSGGTGGAFGIVCNSPSVSTININGNKISGLSSSVVAGTFAAIRILNAAIANVGKNKIYDVSGGAAGSIVYGIDVQSTNTGVCNISNNYIGDLRSPVSTNANAIRGIIISSISPSAIHNIYYNTIYLNATSSGTNFGTSGIFLASSGTPANGQTSLRNNIIINLSVATGTALTVAYRRTLVQLDNYAASSNNNIFYAGIPSASNVIFNDGTNSDQTLAAYQSRVSTRDAASFTESTPFLSITGSSPDFLHLDPAVPTQAESGAVNIAGYTDDYDGDIRFGNPGYAGAITATAPDIGADETNAIYSELNPPVITYTNITSPTCTFTGMTLAPVTITDATGVPLTGSDRPRIYYRKNAGGWFSAPGTNTSGTSTNSVWSFTIVETDMGGVSSGDVISYYIIAQDLNPVPNVGSNPVPGLVATSVNSVTTHPTSPNTYTLKYNLNGLYTVGIAGDFTTLTAAVIAYNNACALSGPIVFELIDNSYPSETFPIDIQLHPDASAAHTLTIRPSATATPLITGSAAQIINLNGAKYITFDGRQGGTGTPKSLTIINNVITGVTIQFINDAQNDNLKYCIIQGMRASSSNGTILFGVASATGTGNDNNTIDNNDITDAAGGQSVNGICSVGIAGKENDNIIITNNNISNYYSATGDSRGIYIVSNSSSWTITGNRFFQTATRLYSGAVIVSGIYINAGSGYTISNNIIGYANSASTGTTNLVGNSVALTGFPTGYTPVGVATSIRCVGIGLGLALVGTPSNVDGNAIGGIAMYTSNANASGLPMFCGIYVESGTANIGVNAGNIIGSTSGTNSIYIATSEPGGAFFGIKTSSLFNVAIQNNTIGSITVSGTSAAATGSFTGISFGGLCSYIVSNNSIGNADIDNIRLGYTVTGGQLSNTGTLTPTNPGVSTIIKGIASTGSGNTVSITNNTLRGWVLSCNSSPNLTGIETSGAMSGATPSLSVSNNFIGTTLTNWVNATVDQTTTFYGINMNSTGAKITNIKNNDFRGIVFGARNGAGGGLIKLTGSSTSNNITTISGNTFTNLNFHFNAADLYFIFTNYALSSTGQLIIDNNKIVGTFSAVGTANYHLINLIMTASSGAKADITNNDFSNITTSGASSVFSLLYTSFSINPCLLNITGNVFTNLNFGPGFVDGIDIADMTGTANCSNNTISNISGQGYMTGITLDPSGSSGQFNVTNNTISGFVSTGIAGFINGIAANISPLNATQTTINQNTISGFSSTNLNGDIAGIYLDNGFATSTVSVTKNKIYDLSESNVGSNVYGINNYTSLKGIITYSNNYIGDLRAPLSNVGGPAVTGIKLFLLSGQANVYYNTIHLNATGTAPVFSTAAVYADGATQVKLRNNIFSNISGHGSTGRTVAYWRSNSNLSTYDISSNNNLFYAGTASAQNLIYYDGTNSDQLFTAYKTRVAARDNLSVSALTGFISTIGSNTNFLHITATGNCSMNATGNNAGILLSTDYDNDARSTVSPFITDIGADEFSKKNAWTGANGTNWNDAGNWSEGVVPNTDDDNVVISNPPANQPVIAAGDTYQVGSLIMGTGAGLSNRGTLKVAGYIYADVGSFNNIQASVVVGSVEMNGNCSLPQPLAGNVFAANSVKNFIVSNDVNISTVTGEQLNISRALSFGAVTGKTLTTGDNLVLLSTMNATANVTDVTNNSISGKATVERYINTGTNVGTHLKGWQFLATPTQGQTVFQSWQENGATPAGYGTIITGTGSGFDLTTVTPSMKYYDPIIGTNGAWVGITTTAGLVNDQRGYMLFVRGDRTVTTLGASANLTNMRTKGTLYQPNNLPPVTNVAAGKLASVGNPYASTISLDYMNTNGLFVNLNNDAVVWDPLLYGYYGYGGYQTLSASNNYEPTAGGTDYYAAGVASPYIQSGQVFFVKSAGSPGTVTFTEACKKDTNKLVNRLTGEDSRQYFRAGLFTNTGIVADGNAVVFDDSYANAIDADDAFKFLNTGENFMITREAQNLSVEARSVPLIKDTIFYSLSNLRKQPYQLRFVPKNMQAGDLKAYLIDKYLHTTTELNLTDSNFINIVINDDNLSSAADRFFVVFEKVTIVPVSITSISANRNADKTIMVKWKVENEINIDNYSLEKSADGQIFTGIAPQKPFANNGSASAYHYNDANPFSGNNFYRIKATGLSGQVQYSGIVKVGPLQEAASIIVYPNPVENKTINIHFVNQSPGTYKLQLTNTLGQVIYNGSVEIDDTNITRAIALDKSIATGNYQLNIITTGGKKYTQQIIIR